MKTQQERDINRKKLKNRLALSFIAALLAATVSELLLQHVIDHRIMPTLQQFFLSDIGVEETWLRLSTEQMASLMGGSLLIWALNGVSGMFPMLSGAALLGESAVRSSMAEEIPMLSDSIRRIYPTSLTSLLVSSAFLLLLALIILPIALIAVLYLRYLNREIERVREEEEKIYEETDRDRNLMLSDIAHDLRNPITTVAGYAEALEDGIVKDEAKQKQYLHAIRQKSMRLNELIELLFEYAKLNSTGFTLNKAQIDLCELVRSTAAEMYCDVEAKNMELAADIPETRIMISADRLQLSRVVANLISNAVRYNPEHTKILLQITSDPAETGDTKLIIADSGVVIPDEQAARLFDPFYRGDSSRRTDGGSGLGLSIAKTITGLHGYELSLDTGKAGTIVPAGYTKAFVIRIPW